MSVNSRSDHSNLSAGHPNSRSGRDDTVQPGHHLHSRPDAMHLGRDPTVVRVRHLGVIEVCRINPVTRTTTRGVERAASWLAYHSAQNHASAAFTSDVQNRRRRLSPPAIRSAVSMRFQLRCRRIGDVPASFGIGRKRRSLGRLNASSNVSHNLVSRLREMFLEMPSSRDHAGRDGVLSRKV